jgi:hypothetical protein
LNQNKNYVSAEKSGKVITKKRDRVSGTNPSYYEVMPLTLMHKLSRYLNAKSDYVLENAYKTGGVTKQQLDQAK